jgi:GT2 family glycosyltransferase/glycosyltransferase involved in cell wall biosynthesis
MSNMVVSSASQASPDLVPTHQSRKSDSIEFFGYSVAAGGWLWCGRITSSSSRPENGVKVSAGFQHGWFAASAAIFYPDRPDRDGGQQDVIVFVRAPTPPASLGGFVRLRITINDGNILNLEPSSPVEQIQDPDLGFQVRAMMLGSQSAGRRGLLKLLFPDEHHAVPTSASCSTAIDFIEYGAGFIVVAGWLAVPRNQPWPETVAIRIGAHVFLLTHWFTRNDLPDDPEGPLILAFFEDFAWPEPDPPADVVRVYLDDKKAPLMVVPAARWMPFVPQGCLDTVSQAEFSGWIYDPSFWHSKGTATLSIAGHKTIPLPLTVHRGDLTFAASQRGEKLGFRLDAVALGEAFCATPIFGENQPQLLTIMTSGVMIYSQMITLPPISQGKLEHYIDGGVKGWAMLRGHPNSNVAIEIMIDGVPYGVAKATRLRKDLQTKGMINQGGGFSLPLRWSPSGQAKLLVQARICGEQQLLRGSPLEISGLPIPAGAGASSARGLASARPCVTIIIPIYNAAAELVQCLESVVSQTGGNFKLLLIDDASPDPRVTEVLDAYRNRPGITILRNRQNRGFTRTCNRGIKLAKRDDVVLLNSDTLVPARWLENLMMAAYSAPNIASATPLSDNAGAFSAPERNQRNLPPPGLSVSEVSRLVAHTALAMYPEVPTGHGFCMYLRRSALNAVGLLDEAAFPRGYGEENDLSMRALRIGLRHVVDSRTYVQHRQSASFGEAKGVLLAQGRAVLDTRYPEYTQLIRNFAQDELMSDLRWRVRSAFRSYDRPRPRILFVISTDSGGTPQTNLDLMRALEDRYEPWLLRCDSSSLELQRLRGGTLEPVSKQALEQPIKMVLHWSESYSDAVAALLVLHAIELVHIRHIAWHGLDLPTIARTLGIPVVLSLHDFYVVCPTIKLLDGEQRYCAGRCSVGQGDCRAELWPSDQVPQLRNRYLHRWREMMAPALNACDAFVTTSDTARTILIDAYPEMAQRDFRVIRHGRSFGMFQRPEQKPRHNRPLRILVPGNISAAKGAALIKSIADLDEGQQVEFHILGDAGTLRQQPGLVIHGRYVRENFVERVQEIAPDIGAVLSIWPETYCHTLTELWASGLPVFALDFGAVGERIRAHGGGWLSSCQDATELLAELIALASEQDGFARRLHEVSIWQQGEGLLRDVNAMAADYDRLYRELAHRRLALAPPFTSPGEWLIADFRTDPSAAIPAALTNRANGPVLFRKVPLALLPQALEDSGLQGLVMLADHLEVSATAGIIARCQARGLFCMICPAELPETISLSNWAGQNRVVLGLVESPPTAMPLPMLDLSLEAGIVQSQLVQIASVIAEQAIAC